MDPFNSATHSVGGHDRRAQASQHLDGASLPSWELEEWRYSPIEDLELERYAVVDNATPLAADELAALQVRYSTPNLVVTRNGLVIHAQGVVETDASDDAARLDANGDLFGDMNELFAPAPLRLTVKAGAMIEDDIVIVHLIDQDGAAVFTRLVVDAGDSSAVKILEVFESTDIDALVVPQIEISCGGSANVGYVAQQQLGPRVWQVGSQISEVGQQGTFRSSIAAFGGHYARMRSDCRLQGRGAHGDLDAIYFGDSDQVLDFRTFQDHNAPNTTSNLLFKGVVDDASRAIYSGLIRVSEDAPGTVAFQTNSNIKLGAESWAESVPNLEIETNDVKCSHASTVGPIDEEQRFYLETRGVPPHVADQLIVAGFFDEVIADLPIKTTETSLRAAIAQKLGSGTLGDVVPA
ncbi:MAG: SufD family Fe-S cluster assembly protein [Acidimicrobiaceae bacterium]|nr:SufD family Fe-S cluster assembly protein [Acidimicrobiaceae bacterium]